jgi:hypothetical protein
MLSTVLHPLLHLVAAPRNCEQHQVLSDDTIAKAAHRAAHKCSPYAHNSLTVLPLARQDPRGCAAASSCSIIGEAAQCTSIRKQLLLVVAAALYEALTHERRTRRDEVNTRTLSQRATASRRSSGGHHCPAAHRGS